MKSPLLLLALSSIVLLAEPAYACPYCHEKPLVWASIFDENFSLYLTQILSALPLLIGIGLSFRLIDRHRKLPSEPRWGPFLSAGVILGMGLGGFLDGIVLHMLLQWHNLIAQHLPPIDFVNLKINMFWDGIFNLGMLTLTLLGITLLFRARRIPDGASSGRALVGALFIGWGVFQIVDSILFHWVYALHHIKQGSPNVLLWDLGYFVMGILLVGSGWVLVNSCRSAGD